MFGKNSKEYNYFESFCQVGKTSANAAVFLNETLNNFNSENINEYADKMHCFENEADAKRHELCKKLAYEFMPPIEREDISVLSQELDNIVDSVEDVMRKIYMLNIKTIRSEALEFSLLIMQSCNLFEKLLTEFANFKKSKTIHDYIIEINTLENKGDKLHSDTMRRLFTEEISATEQLSWTMIFQTMEDSLDVCETAADIIDSIITKNT